MIVPGFVIYCVIIHSQIWGLTPSFYYFLQLCELIGLSRDSSARCCFRVSGVVQSDAVGDGATKAQVGQWNGWVALPMWSRGLISSCGLSRRQTSYLATQSSPKHKSRIHQDFECPEHHCQFPFSHAVRWQVGRRRMWEEMTQGLNTRRPGSLGASFGDWLPCFHFTYGKTEVFDC